MARVGSPPLPTHCSIHLARRLGALRWFPFAACKSATWAGTCSQVSVCGCATVCVCGKLNCCHVTSGSLTTTTAQQQQQQQQKQQHQRQHQWRWVRTLQQTKRGSNVHGCTCCRSRELEEEKWRGPREGLVDSPLLFQVKNCRKRTRKLPQKGSSGSGSGSSTQVMSRPVVRLVPPHPQTVKGVKCWNLIHNTGSHLWECLLNPSSAWSQSWSRGQRSSAEKENHLTRKSDYEAHTDKVNIIVSCSYIYGVKWSAGASS